MYSLGRIVTCFTESMSSDFSVPGDLSWREDSALFNEFKDFTGDS